MIEGEGGRGGRGVILWDGGMVFLCTVGVMKKRKG